MFEKKSDKPNESAINTDVFRPAKGSAKVVIAWGEGVSHGTDHAGRVVGKGASKVGTISGLNITTI